MAGCDSCEKNLKAELGSKDEEELTDEERAILEGESDPPKYNGPLAPVNVDYCEFCHGVGQAGALIFGSLFALIGILEISQGIGILIGLVVWVGLAIVVGYVGHFPVLGPLFGPIVEKVFALQFGIYLTEKARQQYGTGAPTTDGGRPGHTQSVERRFPMKGTEMHVVAAPWALEQCADMDEQGALVRVEVENGQIVDIHNYHPKFNRFPNVRDHVRSRQFDNVCKAHSQTRGPTTTIEFSELLNSDGKEGIQ